MSKQGGAPAAAAPAAAAPPPPAPQTPVSGIQPPRRAIAPQLGDEPKGINPVKELEQRQRAAIAKHAQGQQAAEDAGAREGAAPPPKAKPVAASAEAATSAGKTPAAPQTGSTKPGSTIPAGGKTADGGVSGAADGGDSAGDSADGAGDAGGSPEASRARAPRYDVQSMRKWAEENPEEAALLREKVFALPADTNSEWIRLKNAGRKQRERLRAENEAQLSEAKRLADQAAADKAEMLGAADKLGPIGDLFAAVADKVRENPESPDLDFDAGDAAFQELTGLELDTYMRLRARKRMGGGGPEAARLRVQLAKERRELQVLKAKEAPASKEEAKPEAEDVPEPPKGKQRAPQHDWSGEIDAKHKIRQLDGWQLKLDDEMRKFFDPDTRDYDEDPEKAADRVLKREIEAMAEEFEEEAPPPKPRKPAAGAKPPPAPPPRKPKASADGVPSAAELTPSMDPDESNHPVVQKWEKRKNWALDRAMRRARGEEVD